MCTPHSQRAIALEHGTAHDHDHALWTRRDFLVRSGLTAAAGGALVVGGAPVRALGRSALLEHLAHAETDRVLVLIQLNGGNDGLNTIVPYTNDIYYNARPTLAIAPDDVTPLDDAYGFHPALNSLESAWGEGQMAVLHNVGYPDPDLSHFRGTDIWVTASDADEVLDTGWVGRQLQVDFPDFYGEPPPQPPAVQIGASTPLLFQGANANYALSLTDPALLEQIVQFGGVYDPDDVPPTTYGSELAYIRNVANTAFLYLDAVQAAADEGSNTTEYPDGRLGESLAATARLIKGRLGARIYLVALDGFDTHAAQPDLHHALLSQLADAVAAFYTDLGASDDDQRVLMATFSEFGRRIEENGSDGTDHGTAAPLFAFGPAVEGGFYGDGPDLANPDIVGNIVHSTDFRAVYASLLQLWFDLDAALVTELLGGSFDPIPFVNASPVAADGAAPPVSFGLEANYPNPFRSVTTVAFSLTQPSDVRLRIYDTGGRLVTTLADGRFDAGTHTARFDGSALPSGTYHCVLDSAEGRRSHSMTLIR